MKSKYHFSIKSIYCIIYLVLAERTLRLRCVLASMFCKNFGSIFGKPSTFHTDPGTSCSFQPPPLDSTMTRFHVIIVTNFSTLWRSLPEMTIFRPKMQHHFLKRGVFIHDIDTFHLFWFKFMWQKITIPRQRRGVFPWRAKPYVTGHVSRHVGTIWHLHKLTTCHP